jgi:hypothetical protein
VREVINDLWLLIRDYAKQETIDPLKMLGSFLGFGLAGAISLSLGLGFGALAILRALQVQTGDHLTGSLTFVPYLVALVFTGGATAIAVWYIKRPFRHEEASA